MSSDLRRFMIDEMREHIPAGQAVNTCSRFGSFFYRPLEFPEGTVIGKGMRRRIAKFTEKTVNKWNVDNLELFTDYQLFCAFQTFVRCRSRWM